MPDPIDPMPWMSAWLDAERRLADPSANPPVGGEDAMRRLLTLGRDYLAIGSEWWRHFAPQAQAAAVAATAPPGFEAMRALMVERYQRLFTPEFPTAASVPDTAAGSAGAMLRYRAAWQSYSQQIARIANDAFRRLAAELARTDAAAAPISSLRELHELWVDCGETAYAAAAHGEAFAAAQAELLAAFVELRFEQQQAAQ